MPLDLPRQPDDDDHERRRRDVDRIVTMVLANEFFRSEIAREITRLIDMASARMWRDHQAGGP